MTTDIIVPDLGESITEASVSKWLKSIGQQVQIDEPLVELETDKVTIEVNAPAAGVLAEIVEAEGTDVAVGAVLGKVGEAGEVSTTPSKPASENQQEKQEPAPVNAVRDTDDSLQKEKKETTKDKDKKGNDNTSVLSPAVRKLVVENKLDSETIPASGKNGRLTKGDVLQFMETEKKTDLLSSKSEEVSTQAEQREERVKMTKLRKVIARRLKDAQNTAAILSTFNEVDMTAVMDARRQYKELFEKRHGVKMGFMSFFIKATIQALKDWPSVNAEIDEDHIVYKNHYDIAVAVGSPQGLVVPVIRDADHMSFAQIEETITDFGARARAGKLTVEEMQGGTFTISNGGIFGSLLSTPILNPPQSGILGMHKIQPRPVVMADGSIQARPMMYLALSYDHRIVDGREAVSFLVRIKESIEDPQRILLEM